jgi:hypothetical protein
MNPHAFENVIRKVEALMSKMMGQASRHRTCHIPVAARAGEAESPRRPGGQPKGKPRSRKRGVVSSSKNQVCRSTLT